MPYRQGAPRDDRRSCVARTYLKHLAQARLLLGRGAGSGPDEQMIRGPGGSGAQGAFAREWVGHEAMDESAAGGTAGRRSERSSSGAVLPGRRQHSPVGSGGPADPSCASTLASLVHELRTPMTALATSSEL